MSVHSTLSSHVQYPGTKSSNYLLFFLYYTAEEIFLLIFVKQQCLSRKRPAKQLACLFDDLLNLVGRV